MARSSTQVSGAPRARGREIGAGVALATGAVLVGLLAFEGLARVVFDRNGMHYGIEMWKYAREVKRSSSNAAMGHEHAPDRETVLMGVPVRTNSLGLRDREFAAERPPGVRRIVVLGDSMTFGWGVREEDTYPKVLERLLNGHGTSVEVINTGVGNYNTAQQVAYFRERGTRLHPDEVILGFYINDAEPTPSPRENLLARHSYAYVLAFSLWELVGRQAGWRPDLTTYYAGLYEEESPGWEACQDALTELILLCRRSGIRLTIAIIPELHAPNADYPFRRAHERVRAVAERQGATVVDLLPAFDGHDPRSLWVSPGDAHANALAHEIIGQTLHDAIAGPDELPWIAGTGHEFPEVRYE